MLNALRRSNPKIINISSPEGYKPRTIFWVRITQRTWSNRTIAFSADSGRKSTSQDRDIENVTPQSQHFWNRTLHWYRATVASGFLLSRTHRALALAGYSLLKAPNPNSPTREIESLVSPAFIDASLNLIIHVQIPCLERRFRRYINGHESKKITARFTFQAFTTGPDYSLLEYFTTSRRKP